MIQPIKSEPILTYSDCGVQVYATMASGFFGPRDARDIAISAVTSAVSRGGKSVKMSAEDIHYAFEQCIKRYDALVDPLAI